jgi:hypothetical protein
MKFFNFLKTIRQSYFKKINTNFFSQFGEDRILLEILKPKFTKGFYVDVGCYHPKKHSNTYLLHKKGWSGINIDIEQNKIDVFNLMRPGDLNILAPVSNEKKIVVVKKYQDYGVGSKIERVTNKKNNDNYLETKTLNNIIYNSKFRNKKIDLLSIDTEGSDLEVLLSLDFIKHRPNIIVIESHLSDIKRILNSKIFIFLSKKNYKLRSWNFFSLIFVYKYSTITRKR